MQALDADRDGTLSAEEISAASDALQSLDKNDDGKLTEDELRPPRPQRGDGRAGAAPEASARPMVVRRAAMVLAKGSAVAGSAVRAMAKIASTVRPKARRRAVPRVACRRSCRRTCAMR